MCRQQRTLRGSSTTRLGSERLRAKLTGARGAVLTETSPRSIPAVGTRRLSQVSLPRPMPALGGCRSGSTAVRRRRPEIRDRIVPLPGEGRPRDGQPLGVLRQEWCRDRATSVETPARHAQWMSRPEEPDPIRGESPSFRWTKGSCAPGSEGSSRTPGTRDRPPQTGETTTDDRLSSSHGRQQYGRIHRSHGSQSLPPTVHRGVWRSESERWVFVREP